MCSESDGWKKIQKGTKNTTHNKKNYKTKPTIKWKQVEYTKQNNSHNHNSNIYTINGEKCQNKTCIYKQELKMSTSAQTYACS